MNFCSVNSTLDSSDQSLTWVSILLSRQFVFSSPYVCYIAGYQVHLQSRGTIRLGKQVIVLQQQACRNVSNLAASQSCALMPKPTPANNDVPYSFSVPTSCFPSFTLPGRRESAQADPCLLNVHKLATGARGLYCFFQIVEAYANVLSLASLSAHTML